jgi:ubiquinone biosynthesis protein Coq4
MEDVKVGNSERAYFNGAIQTVSTQSSVLVSSSAYLNHDGLRSLIAQEMLRRNGPDLPVTAYIPEVVQIFFQLEDLGRVIELFEEERRDRPEFNRWLEQRQLADFKIDDVKHCAPGTLGAALHDFMVNSGYELDIFYREIQVVNEFTFYLRQTALTHDIEHIVSGFGPNHGGELALVSANLHSRVKYFGPELAAFFNRVQTYLKAKTIMKDGLYYPQAAALGLEAEYVGATQGRNWKYPIMLVNWREYTDVQIADIRKELGITPVLAEGLWDHTDAFSMEPRANNDDAPIRSAAE